MQRSANAMVTPIPIPNRLLRALPTAQYQCLELHLDEVHLSFGDVLYEVNASMDYVYFPNDALISLLTQVDAHRALEVGMVGAEGMLGVTLALGAQCSPMLALVQGAGTAMRLKGRVFLREFRRGLWMQRVSLTYANTLTCQIAQTAACNRFHALEARLARWLLMTRDRVGSDYFHLTQDFLSTMLGVRRVGVSKAANALKLGHIIDYSRGSIEIVDGPALEALACSCYQLTDVSHSCCK